MGLKSAIAVLILGATLQASQWHSILEDPALARHFMSDGLWRHVVQLVGVQTPSGRLPPSGESLRGKLEFLPLVVAFLGFSLASWFCGARLIAWRRGISWRAALGIWGLRAWGWWLLPGVWEALRLIAFVLTARPFESLLMSTPEMWQAAAWAGWLSTGLYYLFPLAAAPAPAEASTATSTALEKPPRAEAQRLGWLGVPAAVWCAAATYLLCFGAMNAMLYLSLRVPHGDSAMYEEHLWNLLHGKGFRSYLDNGRLFLGEHVQVIHLLLIPIYLVWPSHLTLELCQSAALALGAIPVFWIAYRHSQSTRGAGLVACAYLRYFPMQFLDISIDFKTFRPNAFEIPLLLFALDALERGRYRTMLALMFLTLLAQEDAAPLLAPLGLWIAARQPREILADRATTRRIRWLGIGLTVFSVGYLLLVIRVILPYFRSGSDVHFAAYFSKLGGSTTEIVRNVLTHPGLLLGELISVETTVYALAMLLPLGLLPLFSPGRLAVAAPLFGVLCLNEIAKTPLHHFHAPLVPIVVWAAAAGMGNAAALWDRLCAMGQPGAESGRRSHRFIPKASFRRTRQKLPVTWSREVDATTIPADVPSAADKRNPRAVYAAALWCACCALTLGACLGLSPLSIGFWDPHSSAYWRSIYVPDQRAAIFPVVLAEIPPSARVASTDFVHPRFTHFERSYDYSDYRPLVPADTDYIVIDTHHPYSKIKQPQEVPEYRDHPEQWQLLPDRTGGYFIVLKRVRKREH